MSEYSINTIYEAGLSAAADAGKWVRMIEKPIDRAKLIVTASFLLSELGVISGEAAHANAQKALYDLSIENGFPPQELENYAAMMRRLKEEMAPFEGMVE